MLEDDFNDCLSKAIRGHGCTIAQLAMLAGIGEERIIACLNGHEDKAVIHLLAPHLQLDAEKLLGLSQYNSSTQSVPGLTRVISPFGHLGVNAYIVQQGDTTLIFDTGTDPSELRTLAPAPTRVFITHKHTDHIAGLSHFDTDLVNLPEAMHHAEHFKLGTLAIKVLDVSGHDTPARAYFIEGLVKPICIVGDALFAGSIGKCMSTESYSTALANIRDHLLTLPDETILCPGHGPLTTVVLEKAHNPFF